MSVLIRGMEMPKACVYRENGHLITCPLYDIDGYCGALNTEASHKENGKLSGCPLIPVPPHGRLVEADKIYDAVEKRYRISSGVEHRCERDLLDLICSAPTIIEAEEGE